MHKNAICAVVFIITFLVFVTSPVITSYDSRWAIPTSISILYEGNTNLNEFDEMLEYHDYYYIEDIGGKKYTYFPHGVSFLSLPFVALADILFQPFFKAFPTLETKAKQILAKGGRPVESLKLVHLYQPIELVIASFFCAIAVACMFLISRQYLNTPYSLLVVFILAFCTSTWSTSSRALWQHGPSMLLLTITLYLIILESKYEGIIKFTAIPLAMAFIIRPTNAIPILFITSYIYINHRSQIIKYILIATPFAAAFFIYNLMTFNTLFPAYYFPDRVFKLDNFPEALTGNLISPARGVFIFTPIYLFSIAGLIMHLKRETLNSLPTYLFLSIVVHWLVISTHPDWWAGHSYGPRHFSEYAPFFIFFIVLLLSGVAQLSTRKRIAILMIPFLLFGFFVHAKGGYFQSVFIWNVNPVNVIHAPDRIWDWSDLQFLR